MTVRVSIWQKKKLCKSHRLQIVERPLLAYQYPQLLAFPCLSAVASVLIRFGSYGVLNFAKKKSFSDLLSCFVFKMLLWPGVRLGTRAFLPIRLDASIITLSFFCSSKSCRRHHTLFYVYAIQSHFPPLIAQAPASSVAI